jgi:hypothetical protein
MSAPPPMSMPVVYGSVSGAQITGYVNADALKVKQSVTLSANYVRNPPPTYTYDANPGTAAAKSLTGHPQTIPAGTTIVVFQAEAAALIAAGAAS